MSLEFKIGMVGPSKAGKTTLMTSIYEETQTRLSGKSIEYVACDQQTKTAIELVVAEFKACTATGDSFDVPQMNGTESIRSFKFAFKIPVEAGEQDISIDVLDYPGGLLGIDEPTGQVRSHLNESDVLLVPVPADILMEWKRTYTVNNDHDKRINIVAQCMLCVNSVLSTIKKWAAQRVANQQNALLIFVPIRCEAYFKDNGGTKDESATLHEAVRQLYVDALDLDKNAEMKRRLQIEIHAVDTYGIVELRDVEYDMKRECLISTFKRRMQYEKREELNQLKTKGAFGVLATIVQFRLNELAKKLGIQAEELENAIKSRNFLEWLLDFITGKNKKMNAELAEFIRQNEVVIQAMSTIAGLSRQDHVRQMILNELEN